MKIDLIKIKNFRQFSNEAVIHLSTDEVKNVTVIHGANGSGKTSLLNAFKWCFYGETDFDTRNDNILNESAIHDCEDNGVLELRIEVRFSHEGKKYGAIRHQKFKKISSIKAKELDVANFELDITGEDGQTIRSRQPHVDLQNILPMDLQPYFFFNGERIEKIAGVGQGVLIQEAIKKLMGLELVDRAIDHTRKAKKKYRELLRTEVSDDHKELLDLISALEDQKAEAEKNIDNAKKRKAIATQDIDNLDAKLKTFDQSRNLQKERDKLDEEIDKIDDNLILIKSKQKKILDDKSFLIISNNIFEDCSALIDQNRKKGVLPYGIKEQFIDDRIEMGSCICGTKIQKGSEEHRCLLKVRETAGTDSQESIYTSVSALLKSHDEIYSDFSSGYKELSKELQDELNAKSVKNNRISEISAQMGRLDNELIKKLEEERSAKIIERDNAIGDLRIAQNEFDSSKATLAIKRDVESKFESHARERDVAQLRYEKIELIENTLTELRDSLSDQVRVDLSERVDSTFQSIIRKPVRAIIDDEYRLQILKKTPAGEEYVVSEQSTGEKQVTSLSFIASIISLAKEKHEKQSAFFQGGLYPLVMDSPFGALDDDYREKVAGSVASLAQQVVMFVSNSQWSGRVKDATSGKVGKSYQLIYHKPNIKESDVDEYTLASDTGHEYSTIEEVSL